MTDNGLKKWASFYFHPSVTVNQFYKMVRYHSIDSSKTESNEAFYD